jgi:ubiquinone/menaquinone biosynthesis C-methylase UbiE
MRLIETEETNRFTFEPFAAHTFYTNINRMLVQQALAHLARTPRKTLTIVDMACGTGAISRLVAEEVARLDMSPSLTIIGIDPSAEALRLAEKSMQEDHPNVQTTFYQGDGSDVDNLVQNVDAAFFCNAIHLVPDKHDAFKHMARILAPNGILACNSAFYQGTYVEGTERFYRLWTRRAIGWLRKEHPDVRPSREEKAMAMQWLTPEEYIEALNASGFCQIDQVRTNAVMSLDAWRDLGHYWLFIDGALPGVPLDLGAEALGVAVYQTGEELGLTEIPRTWLQLVATKCEA